MWGVGIQKNLFNGKLEMKIQLFGNSEQLKQKEKLSTMKIIKT